jgi:hypothetical protein
MTDSDSEDDGNSSDDESSSGSEDESSDSESEDEREKRRRKARKKRSRSGSRRSSSEKVDKLGMPKKRVVKGSQKEVEGLIKQMNLLTQDDPQYGIAYYCALKLDPDISRIVAEPALRRPVDQHFSARGKVTYPQNRFGQPSNPAYYAPRAPVQSLMQPPPCGSEMICFGCGEKGHGMTRCSIIDDMISKNLLARDSGGRMVYGDGSPIRRLNNKTYIQAFERERPPQSHLIMVARDSDTEDEYGSYDEMIGSDQYYDREDRSDVEDVFAIRDVGWETFVADRPEKKIAARQKMVMDGVYPPRLKDISKGKENRPADPETGRPI